jgi:hypothetical protein
VAAFGTSGQTEAFARSASRLERDDFFFESSSRSSLLPEHDLFRKPVSIPGSSRGTGIFGIMLNPH